MLRVIDGDSLEVARRETGERAVVRLFGIDCPELGQPFGKAAEHLARTAVMGKKVGIVELDVDKYGRIVAAVVCLESGVALQDELLRAGLAWVDPRYCKGCKPWKALQREAAKEKRGLWRDAAPAAPWKWRKDRTL